MILTLTGIASALGGRVRGNKVVAPGPEAASKKGYKRRKDTLTVWINPDDDIGVNSWRGQDPIATKDWVRDRCGLPAWKPKKRKSKPLPPFAERNQFLGEALRIARNRKQITFEQFALIINDLKNACPDATLKSRAGSYACQFGFGPAEIEAAMRPEWRSYKASERADIFQTTYDEYRRLGLRRSGCMEVDPAERRRRTKERYNAKRRAERAAKRVSMSADRRAPLCPSEKVGTVRVPSSELVTLVVSRARSSESAVRAESLHSEKAEDFESSVRQAPRARWSRGPKAYVLSFNSKNNRRNQMRCPGVAPAQERAEKRARLAKQNANWPKWRRNTQRRPYSPSLKLLRETVRHRPAFLPPRPFLIGPMGSRRRCWKIPRNLIGSTTCSERSRFSALSIGIQVEGSRKTLR
jgi:hypothetical protein